MHGGVTRQWWRAENRRACFAFACDEGVVTVCAPYGRKMVMGKQLPDAVTVLTKAGFKVQPIGGTVRAQ